MSPCAVCKMRHTRNIYSHDVKHSGKHAVTKGADRAEQKKSHHISHHLPWLPASPSSLPLSLSSCHTIVFSLGQSATKHSLISSFISVWRSRCSWYNTSNGTTLPLTCHFDSEMHIVLRGKGRIILSTVQPWDKFINTVAINARIWSTKQAFDKQLLELLVIGNKS